LFLNSFNFQLSGRRVVSFMPWLLYPWGKSTR